MHTTLSSVEEGQDINISDVLLPPKKQITSNFHQIQGIVEKYRG